MARSFIKLTSSSGTLTKREAAIKRIHPPAIITSAEVIITEYDEVLDQWKRTNFYNHLGLVVRKPVNANPGLKFNRGNNFSCIKALSIAYILCCLRLLVFNTEAQKM